jgi:hypothetical protein
MRMRDMITACGLCAGAALAVAACGGSGSSGSVAASSKTASQLVSQMRTAVRDASSVHLDGQVTSGGRPLGLDLGVRRTGGLAGTITRSGVPLRLIGTGTRVYVQATPGFLHELRASAAVCAVMCGKYVQMNGSQARSLNHSLSMGSLTGALTRATPKFTKAGTATVGGQPAVVLRAADGATLDVAARGKPYPLRVVASRTGETIRFSQWDKVPVPSAPPTGQVINLNQLKAGTS